MNVSTDPGTTSIEVSDHSRLAAESPQARNFQSYQQFGPNLYLYRDEGGVTSYLYFVVKSGQPGFEGNIDIEGDGYGRGGFITFLKGTKEQNIAAGQILAGDYPAGDFPLMLDAGYEDYKGVSVTSEYGSYTILTFAYDWDRTEPVIRDGLGNTLLSSTYLGNSVIYSSLETVGPLESLHVTGDTQMDGTLTVDGDATFQAVSANSISSNSYLNLPPVDPNDLLPLTLDKTNDHVGINKPVPVKALDVVGDGAFTASLSARDLVLSGSGDAQIIGGTASPEAVKTAPPGSIYLRTDGGVNSTLYVKQSGTGNTGWTAFGSFDPLPLTLDKVNGRVGVNNTSPATDLHVVGATTTTTINATNLRGYYLNNSLFMSTRNAGSIAIGDLAGGLSATPDAATDQKIYSVAIGQNAGSRNQGIRCVAVGQYAGSTNQGENAVAIGNSAGGNNQGVEGVAIGTYTSHMGSGANAIAIGKFAGRNLHQANSIILNATGVELNSDGTNRFFVKPVRNENNVQSSLMQYNATTGEITYGVPGYASESVAIGQSAGWGGSAFIKQLDGSVAIGISAGRGSQGLRSIAVGRSAGSQNQGDYAVAVGNAAGGTGQGLNSVAIGRQAGILNQHANSIILNATGADLNSDGISRFYVKPVRNENNVQSSLMQYNATTGEITYGAPGYSAGSTAIGQQAGWGGGSNVKQAANSTAVGYLAGASEQGVSAVSIGEQAGRYTQNPNAIAIGSFAGITNQSNNAIAIGASAGRNNQPQNSVAIGYLAAQNTTGENCIVLNGTGSAFNTSSTQTNSFFVKPIRNVINAALPCLSYNATTGEICYGDSTTTSLLPITLDKVNTRVGINNTTPTTALDVTGTITATNVAGTLTTAAQPNITSVGTLGSLNVGGTITSGAGITSPELDVTGTITATNVAGTLTTAAQPNITSVGTLGSLGVTGTITATNLAGTLTTAAQPNITSVGTLGSLSVTGASSTGTLSLQAIANTTKPNVLYYDSMTKDVTYGAPPTTPPFTPFSPIVTNTVANGESADGTYRQYCNQTIGPGLFSVKALISWGSLGVGGSAVFLQRIKSTVPTIYVEKTGSYSGTTNEEFLSGTIYLTNTETVGVEVQRSGGSGIVNIKFQVIQINNY